MQNRPVFRLFYITFVLHLLFVISVNDAQAGEDEINELPCDLQNKIQKIEKQFWETKKSQCTRSAIWETGKLASFAGANCAGIYLLGYLKDPILRATEYFSSPQESEEKTEPTDFTQYLTANNATPMLIFTALGPYFGSIATRYATMWKTFGKNTVTQLTASFRYSKLTGWVGDPQIVSSIQLLDLLELKYEILKGVFSADDPEAETRLRGIKFLILQVRTWVDILLGKISKNSSHPASAESSTENPKELSAHYKTKVQYTLDFPIQTKRFSSADKERVRTELQSYFGDTFDPVVTEFFYDQADRVIDNALLAPNSPFRDRTNLYLVGAPGTGKTATAEAFARALRLPFCRIDGSSLVPSDFTGSKDRSERNLVSGIIFECLVKQKAIDRKSYLNTIIYIDEADHLLNDVQNGQKFEQIFKTLLENPTFHDQVMDIEFDVSNLIVVLSGNGTLMQNENARAVHVQALNERFHTVEFPKTSLEKRIRIAEKKFLQQISVARSYVPSEEDIRYVKDVLTPYDHERHDGVRVLREIINQFVLKRKSGASVLNFDYKRVFKNFPVSNRSFPVNESTQTDFVPTSIEPDQQVDRALLEALQNFINRELR